MRLRDLGERALLKRLAPLGYPEGAPLPPGDDAGGVWVGEAAWLLKTDGFLYREVATDLGLTGTPTFFIAGEKRTGFMPYEEWKSLLDQALGEKP